MRRRHFLGRTAGAAAALAWPRSLLRFPGIAEGEAGGGEFRVEAGVRQLFLDDIGIERIDGLRRVVNPPARHPENPLLKPDTPWERGCQVYGTAYFDETAKLFKLWYLTGPKDRGLKPLKLPDRERAPHTTLAAYAESKDGIRWIKPKLGLFPYDGDTQNNLLDIGRFNCEGLSVLHEPGDPDPNRRWKAAYWDHGSGGWEVRDGGPFCKEGPLDGWYVAFSPDGIRWTPYEGNPVLRKYCDTTQNVVYDPRIKKYVGFSRFGFGRKLARTESDDFLHWSEPRLVLECDPADGPATQIYGAGIDLYEGLYLGMIWIYREGGDGKIDTQLAVSRDGIRWTRVGDRAPWLALGDEDGWEGGMVRSVGRIICRGDLLHIYYCGVHGAHTGPKRGQVARKHPVQIGLVTQRRDGFVSLDAGPGEGSVTTKPFVCPGGTLHLNADARDGEIAVTVQDRSGKATHRSLPIRGDCIRAAVEFAEESPVRGSPIRLSIAARKAKLYSYWFVP